MKGPPYVPPSRAAPDRRREACRRAQRDFELRIVRLVEEALAGVGASVVAQHLRLCCEARGLPDRRKFALPPDETGPEIGG